MLLLLSLFACSSAPTLEWTAPTDGADIAAGTGDVTVAISGFVLGDDGYIVYSANGEEQGEATTETFSMDIPEGEVTLTAELMTTDGAELDPPVVATVHVVSFSE